MSQPHVIQVSGEFVHPVYRAGRCGEMACRKRTISFSGRGCRWNLLLIRPAATEKPQWHQKDRCPAFAACGPYRCRTKLRPLRTASEVTATNRQPSKKDAFAVSID